MNTELSNGPRSPAGLMGTSQKKSIYLLNSLGAHTEGTMYQRLKARSRINQNAQPPTPRKYSVQYPIFFEIWDTQILLHGIYWAKHKINGVSTLNEQK